MAIGNGSKIIAIPKKQSCANPKHAPEVWRSQTTLDGRNPAGNLQKQIAVPSKKINKFPPKNGIHHLFFRKF